MNDNDEIDAAALIGQEVKSLLELMAEIDMEYPEEDSFEVLVGAFSSWGAVEAQVLFPALESTLEGSEVATEAARQRLNTLYSLQTSIHDGEAAVGPFNQLAPKYMAGVKYHLIADIKELAPLAAQLSERTSQDLARGMAAMKLELE